MNDDEFKKYYESDEANEDSKSDSKVILVLIIVTALPNGLLDVRLPNYKELLYPRKNNYD